MVSYSTNFGNSSDGSYLRIHGEQGSIRSEGNKLIVSAEGAIRKRGSIKGHSPVADVTRPDHFLDWLQCMRTGREPLAPIEAGYQHSVACAMAVMSYDKGTRTTYDAMSRTIQ